MAAGGDWKRKSKYFDDNDFMVDYILRNNLPEGRGW
jgi:hypothetical protein